MSIHSSQFPDNFIWGVSASAAQTEGAYNKDGRGISIWDEFARLNKIKGKQTPFEACHFYENYEQDILHIKSLNISHFRFSLSWSRILPQGTGEVNELGINFYHRVIDTCLKHGIEPWVTLYHWDLPLALEAQGGWTNRAILTWFEDYASICMTEFGNKVKHWMVLNEPLVFTGAGYFAGYHAPGKKGLKNFLPAAYHAALVQGHIGKLIKRLNPNLQVGTTYSCSYNMPYSNSVKDVAAAKKVNALLNRFFIEPSLGMGFPVNDIPVLAKIEALKQAGDEALMQIDFDFIGLQVYTRELIKHSYFTPYLNAKIVPAHKRKVFHTKMNWEVYPAAILEVVKSFSAYAGVKKIIITENGASFDDALLNGVVADFHRQTYLEKHLEKLLEASHDYPKLMGYFVWSATDNFEWTEGYSQRFGLIYINFKSQERWVKNSGYWYRQFLSK
jgi:beta-glucosidase